MTPKNCACVVGWHFPRDTYETLVSIADLKVFVLSHRAPAQLPTWLPELVGRESIFCEPNVGYDWGAYQQFIELGLHRAYSTLFFLHDDVQILDTGFVAACEALLQQGHKIIGNGRNSDRTNWIDTVSADQYAHSEWLPASRSFAHKTVRGSFWAASRETVDALAPLEVFWDRFCLSEHFGNHSLIATSGKAESMFGTECFAYLGEDYLRSPYIIEAVRGGRQDQPKVSIRQRALLAAYRRICRFHVFVRMKQRRIIASATKPLVMSVAGRDSGP